MTRPSAREWSTIHHVDDHLAFCFFVVSLSVRKDARTRQQERNRSHKRESRSPTHHEERVSVLNEFSASGFLAGTRSAPILTHLIIIRLCSQNNFPSQAYFSHTSSSDRFQSPEHRHTFRQQVCLSASLPHNMVPRCNTAHTRTSKDIPTRLLTVTCMH